MSVVMRIGPNENVAQRARHALWEADRDGRLPQQWTFGRDVWNRLRRDSQEPVETFFGLPFVVKVTAPADLLELDAF